MTRIYVITGSNKGIGYGVARNLPRYIDDDSIVYMTGYINILLPSNFVSLARDLGRGQKAYGDLKDGMDEKDYEKVSKLI